MALVRESGRAEEAWTWLCRALAVVVLAFLLATTGLEAPMGAYLLLLGLFFGPEVIRGQLNINRQSKDEDGSK
jgi:hypothetical protein